jgi:hypothetical protein
MARYVGVDLHRNQFTVCIRAEDGREDLCEYRLHQLPRFVGKLRPSDEVAVEVTGNTRLFYDAVENARGEGGGRESHPIQGHS